MKGNGNHRKSNSTSNEYVVEDPGYKNSSIQPKQSTFNSNSNRQQKGSSSKGLKDLLFASQKQRQSLSDLNNFSTNKQASNPTRSRSNSKDNSVKTPNKAATLINKVVGCRMSKIQGLEEIIQQKINKHENKSSAKKFPSPITKLSNHSPISASRRDKSPANKSPNQSKKNLTSVPQNRSQTPISKTNSNTITKSSLSPSPLKDETNIAVAKKNSTTSSKQVVTRSVSPSPYVKKEVKGVVVSKNDEEEKVEKRLNFKQEKVEMYKDKDDNKVANYNEYAKPSSYKVQSYQSQRESVKLPASSSSKTDLSPDKCYEVVSAKTYNVKDYYNNKTMSTGAKPQISISKSNEIEVKKILDKRKEEYEKKKVAQSSISRRLTSFDPDKATHDKYIAKETTNNSLSSMLNRNLNLNANNNYIKLESNDSHQVNQVKIKTLYEISKCGYSGPDVEKVNQDVSIIFPNFAGKTNSFFLSVCDGHGANGHEVSAFLKENLAPALSKSFQEKSTSKKHKIIDEVFFTVNSRLFNDSSLDSSFSGSTCVSVIIEGNSLICANVGDSRAIKASFIDNEWMCTNLSRDHKPSEKDEAMRIIRRGGRIDPIRDSFNKACGPGRVWLKNENIPGLAMTRSFGDKIAASVGVSAEPEIVETTLCENDKFLVIASDGIWEFISSDECVLIVKDFYKKNDIRGACEFMVKEAREKWTQEEEIIDDITIVIVFFD